MAWRNIWRHWRRSAITIVAIGAGLGVLIFHQSLVIGFQQRIVENSVSMHSGHIQIHLDGYHDKKKPEIMIDDPALIVDLVSTMDGVAAYGQRVNFRGLISSAENSAGVQIFGVEPSREMELTSISGKLIEGVYLEDGDDWGILIGEGLAEDIESGVGDKLVMMIQALDGSIGAELFRVKGIFDTGTPFDDSVVYVTVGAAQNILVMGSAVTEVAIKVKEWDGLDPVVAALRANPATEGMEVLDWKEISPEVVQIIELQGAALLIILVIVFSIVALGVINTMLMSVMERTREFGVMMALGTKPGQIVALIVIEAFFLGTLGLLFGFTGGFSAAWYFSIHGIDLSSFTEALEGYMPGELVMYTTFSLKYTVISAVAVMLTSLLSSLYPAYRAARLRPVEAIRYI